jgi:hypothetical protein
VANKVIEFGLDNPGAPIWWVAPTFELSEIGRDKIFEVGRPELFNFDKEKKARKILPLITGAEIQFKSADNPTSLLGKGVALLVIDEAARIPDDVYYRTLRRTLLDHEGNCIAISTPKGKNWFYRLWLKGQDSLQPNYASFSFPTSANPFIPKVEIEKARDDVPELIYRQEYMAEFLEGASSVFRNIDVCATGQSEEPIQGLQYIIGTDVAKYQDFWVNTVIKRRTKQVVAFDRSNKLDWNFQKERLKILAEKYNHAQIVIDSTGVGDPIFEDLTRMELNVEPYQFTSKTKRPLIENLALLMEKQEVSFPPIPDLLNELKSFEYELTSGGNLRYSAPQGFYDDCVISLALACWKCDGQKIEIKTSERKISSVNTYQGM